MHVLIIAILVCCVGMHVCSVCVTCVKCDVRVCGAVKRIEHAKRRTGSGIGLYGSVSPLGIRLNPAQYPSTTHTQTSTYSLEYAT